MIKQAFERGFFKAALDNGVNPLHAATLAKQAANELSKSATLGGTIGGGLAGAGVGGLAGGLGGAINGGLLGVPIGAVVGGAREALSDKKDKHIFGKTLSGAGYGGLIGAGAGGAIGGLAGGLEGGIGGAALGNLSTELRQEMLKHPEVYNGHPEKIKEYIQAHAHR